MPIIFMPTRECLLVCVADFLGDFLDFGGGELVQLVHGRLGLHVVILNPLSFEKGIRNSFVGIAPVDGRSKGYVFVAGKAR